MDNINKSYVCAYKGRPRKFRKNSSLVIMLTLLLIGVIYKVLDFFVWAFGMEATIVGIVFIVIIAGLYATIMNCKPKKVRP